MDEKTPSLFFESPNASPVKARTCLQSEEKLSNKKRDYNEEQETGALSNRRAHLQDMSPNVNTKIAQHKGLPSNQTKKTVPSIEISAPRKDSNGTKPMFHFPRPTLNAPVTNGRSQSSLVFSNTSTSPKHKLRRTNSLMTVGSLPFPSDNQQAAASTSDRFIPSHHNAPSGKLQTKENNPLPNASPQTHIKAQTSKIYQHHVAEACGIEMNSRILQFRPLPPERKKPINLFSHLSRNTNVNSKFALNSLANKSLRPAAASARAKKIPTAPERVLDAPGLADDFYLDLLAWSLTNLLAIGLENAVYVWNASTGSVGLLCELNKNTMVTSLRWSDDGSYISIGKDDGLIEIWDIQTNSKLRTLNCQGHLTRIASQCWSQHILTSGSRVGNIYHSDVRIAQHVVSSIKNTHMAEICGIDYRSDGQQFSTGGNDNLVCIWDARNTHSGNAAQPLFTKLNHKAAVKAMLWCPFQQSLLATGGGSSDKTIHFWNTSTGARVNTIETGSQISSLNWGYATGTGMEVVATHGFPTNNLSLFNYPTLQKTGEIISAHDSRILSGCLSPDMLTLATVAGDENLKFWSLFDQYKPFRTSTTALDDQDDLCGLPDSNMEIKKMMHLR